MMNGGIYSGSRATRSSDTDGIVPLPALTAPASALQDPLPITILVREAVKPKWNTRSTNYKLQFWPTQQPRCRQTGDAARTRGYYQHACCIDLLEAVNRGQPVPLVPDADDGFSGQEIRTPYYSVCLISASLLLIARPFAPRLLECCEVGHWPRSPALAWREGGRVTWPEQLDAVAAAQTHDEI